MIYPNQFVVKRVAD